MNIIDINQEKINQCDLIETIDNDEKIKEFASKTQEQLYEDFPHSSSWHWEIKKLSSLFFFVKMGNVFFRCGINDCDIKEVYCGTEKIGYYLYASFDFYSNNCGFFRVTEIPISYHSLNWELEYRKYCFNASFGIEIDNEIKKIEWNKVYNHKNIKNFFAWWYEIIEKDNHCLYNINVIKGDEPIMCLTNKLDAIHLNDSPNTIGYLSNDNKWYFYDFINNSTNTIPNIGIFKYEFSHYDSTCMLSINNNLQDSIKNPMYLLSFEDLAFESKVAHNMLITNKMYNIDKIGIYKNEEFVFKFENNYKKIGNIALMFSSSNDTFRELSFNNYYVSFSYEECDKIELMYFILRKMKYNFDGVLFQYLNDISVLRRIENIIEIWTIFYCHLNMKEITSFTKKDLEDLKYDYKKIYNDYIKGKRNNIYSYGVQKGIIKHKWASEQKLYYLIVQYYNDAIFQYKSSWLGNQSLDIFIPSLNIGIEYQGKQHFEPVSIFRGDNGFEELKKRDAIKKQKCLMNGITLIEWRYDEKINQLVLEEKLKNVGFIIPPSKGISIDEEKFKYINYYKSRDEEKHKAKKQKEHIHIQTKKFIVQYDTNGNYIAKYSSQKEASNKTNTNVSAISHVIKGLQKTAGGFVWKSFKENEIPTSIEKTSIANNKSVMVKQIDKNGETLNTFSSIADASRFLNISKKSIRNAVHGKQKTAGGFFWEKL